MDNSAKLFFFFLAVGVFGLHKAEFWNETPLTSSANQPAEVLSTELPETAVSPQQLLPSQPTAGHAHRVDTAMFKPAQP